MYDTSWLLSNNKLLNSFKKDVDFLQILHIYEFLLAINAINFIAHRSRNTASWNLKKYRF